MSDLDPQPEPVFMVGSAHYSRPCPWIEPCPVCGAVCAVFVTSSDGAKAPLLIEVDYTCKRRHQKPPEKQL